MKKPPFNSLNIPTSDLKDKSVRKRKSARPTGTRRFVRRARKLTARMKGCLNARLAQIGDDEVKKILIACGVTAVIAVAIIALSKLTPLIVVLLALFGLGFVLQLWERLRFIRIPV